MENNKYFHTGMGIESLFVLLFYVWL